MYLAATCDYGKKSQILKVTILYRRKNNYKKQKEIAMNRILILFFLSLFSLSMLTCSSFRTKTIGNFLQDDDIKAMFENYEYVSNYSYFYTGYGNGPEAILGILKNYELVKVSGRINVTNWQQFEPGGEKLKELVEAIKADRYPERNSPTYGYIISTPGGDQVGVMYAIRLPKTFTQIGLRDGNLITVSPHIIRLGDP